MRKSQFASPAVAVLIALASIIEADERQILQEYASVLSATKGGVDQDDHIWFWKESSATIVRIGADGTTLTSGRLPAARSVDADGRAGIALLSVDGRTLQTMSWDAGTTDTFTLPEPAADVAWVTSSLVAVTPQFADHRIALWDITTGTLSRTIGRALPISRGSGTHLARATLVRYDWRRDELVALDATFGNVYVFSSTGAAVRQNRLPVAALSLQEFLSGHDEDLVTGGRVVALWRYAAMSVSPDGSVWIGGEPETPGMVTLFNYTPGGEMRKVKVAGPACMGSRVLAWRETLLLFSTQSTAASCAAAMEYAQARSTDSATAAQLGNTNRPRRPLLAEVSYPATACAVSTTTTKFGGAMSVCGNTCTCTPPPIACAPPPGTGWKFSDTSCDKDWASGVCTVTCTYWRDTL